MARGRRVDDLNYRRSFFVRMVSDPKIYNPKIVEKSLTDATIDEVVQSPQESADSAKEGRRSSLQSSWISWPLGLLLQGVFEDSAKFRFRNWDTTVTLKPPGVHTIRSRSKSPMSNGSSGSSRSTSPDKC